MSTDNGFRRVRNFVVGVIPVLIILMPLGYSAYDGLIARDMLSDEPFLEMPDASHEACVRETEYMRFHHWELLRSVRDEVMRNGIRGEISLDGCRECHPNRDRFCNRCHEAVSLQPDCWGCHYYPASPATAPLEDRVGLSSWPGGGE